MAHLKAVAAADYIILLTLIIKAHQKNIMAFQNEKMQNYTKH